MIAVPIERPIDFAVESIVERKIGVHPHPIDVEIVGLDVEGILAVVEVAYFKVSVDLIELLPAQSDCLDFRAADALYPNRPLAGCERFAHDRKERAAFKHLPPLELEHDREDIGAVKSIGALGFERQPAGRRGPFDHPHVEKKRFRALPREDLDAVIHAAALFVNAKRNGTAARREAATLLEWSPGFAPTARNVERAVECELALTWREGRLWARCGDLNRPYSKPIDDRVGEDSRGAGLAEHVQYQDKVIWTVGRRERIHIRDIGGRLGERPGPREVGGHGRVILDESGPAFELSASLSPFDWGKARRHHQAVALVDQEAGFVGELEVRLPLRVGHHGSALARAVGRILEHPQVYER